MKKRFFALIFGITVLGAGYVRGCNMATQQEEQGVFCGYSFFSNYPEERAWADMMFFCAGESERSCECRKQLLFELLKSAPEGFVQEFFPGILARIEQALLSKMLCCDDLLLLCYLFYKNSCLNSMKYIVDRISLECKKELAIKAFVVEDGFYAALAQLLECKAEDAHIGKITDQESLHDAADLVLGVRDAPFNFFKNKGAEKDKKFKRKPPLTISAHVASAVHQTIQGELDFRWYGYTSNGLLKGVLCMLFTEKSAYIKFLVSDVIQSPEMIKKEDPIQKALLVHAFMLAKKEKVKRLRIKVMVENPSYSKYFTDYGFVMLAKKSGDAKTTFGCALV